MGGEERMWRVATRGVALALAVVFLFIASDCGEPLGPAPSGWVRYAVFPTECWKVVGLAGDFYSGHVYAVTGGKGDAAIWRYDGRDFREDYVPPYEWEEGWFTDIASAGGTVWAAGGKNEAGRDSPYLIRNLRRSGWLEVPLATSRPGSISAVHAAGDFECWFTIYDGPVRVVNQRRGILARYDDGKVVDFADLGEVTCAVGAKAAGGKSGQNVVFAVEAIGRGEIGDSSVFVTTDAGASWLEERLDFPSPVGKEVETVRAECASGTDLYLFVDFLSGYNGIVKRSGEPGRGEYELVFFATEGPNFKWLSDVAVRGGGVHHSCGVAVGRETSVVYDGADWRLEEVPYPADIEHIAYASDGGFWATADDMITGRWDLLYHR
jgi:hypothetical protein